MAICLGEPREAQYMAGFIALQMSKMWGMFEGGEKRTIDAALEGKQGCPYHNDFKKCPNITEIDQEGILLPSTVSRGTLSTEPSSCKYQPRRKVCTVKPL